MRVAGRTREGAELLAKELQRKRTEKGERITANTIMRVALRTMLENFSSGAKEAINSEEELQQAFSRQFKGK